MFKKVHVHIIHKYTMPKETLLLLYKTMINETSLIKKKSVTNTVKAFLS